MTMHVLQQTGRPPIALAMSNAPGDPGVSAYQIAVRNGFVGDEAAWLKSLASGTYVLFTTDKIVIDNNKMLLPQPPLGALLFNMALVYDADQVVTEYDGVTVQSENGLFYAVFNEPAPVVGVGVVSYLIQAPA